MFTQLLFCYDIVCLSYYISGVCLNNVHQMIQNPEPNIGASSEDISLTMEKVAREHMDSL